MPVGSTLQFFQEQIPVMIPIVEGTEKAALPIQAPLGQAVLPYQAVHTERYVYLEYITGERELYDLQVDPWQISSKHLDPRYARTEAALALALVKLRLCRGNACRAETGSIPDPS
jgi:hypothetical protein